jgi:hypothetical protein
MIRKLDAWHRSRSGLFVFGLVELAITYGFAGLAIDRGNPWWYLLTLVFFVGALRNFVKLIGAFSHGKPRR